MNYFLRIVALFLLSAGMMHAGITVPGTANPYLAGQPDGTYASGDYAPADSPVLVTTIAVHPGDVLSFVVTGSTNNDPGPSGLSPDGGYEFSRGDENGIAGYDITVNSLVGVFLDDSTPSGTAPAALPFAPNDSGFAPGLRQPFFIGDGLTGTGTGERQQFVVPAGATRLFLASTDGCCWNNNYGSFDVEVTNACVAPPGPVQTTQWSPTNEGNGHYYAAVFVPNGINWQDAKVAAFTLGGHLATITSSAENDFAFSLIDDPRFWYRNEFNAGIGPWLGAFQPAGSPEPAGGWQWLTDEDFSYTNWSSGEPNNSGGTEDKLHFYSGGGPLVDKYWNDITETVLTNGYIVEYDYGRPSARGLVAWWPGDDDARDIWSGNNGQFINGASFADGKVAHAFALNGANNFVTVPASPALDVGNSVLGFSVDAWIYPTEDDTNPIVEYNDGNNIGVHLWAGYGCMSEDCSERGPVSGALYANIVGTYNVGIAQHTGVFASSNFISTGGGALPLNTWSHVALTYSPMSGDAVLYINGVEVARKGFGAFTPLTSLPFDIGARPFSDGGCTGAGCYFGGRIDEVELFDRALTTQEILSIFNAGSGGKCKPDCVSSPDGLVGWWPGDGNAADIANGDNGSFQNGATTGDGIVDRAFNFDGTDDFIQVPSAPETELTGSMTVEAWLYLRDYSPELAPIASTWNDIGVSNRSYFLAVAADGRLRFSVSQNGGAYNDVYSNQTVPLNRWIHVAGVFDATTQKIRVYIDGTKDGEGSGPASIHASGEPLLIGAGDLGDNERDFTDGKIDELALYNTALSSDDIMSIFAAHAAGKCKPEQIDVESAFVDKDETFLQTSTADPVLENLPFQLVVGVVATGPGNITSAKFFPPPVATIRRTASSGIPLSSTDGINWSFASEKFSDEETFNQNFGSGDYSFDIHTAHRPFELIPEILIDGDNYPRTPQILNIDWSDGALQIDPTKDYDFVWNDFYGCKTCSGISERPGLRVSGGSTSASTITLRIENESHEVVVEQTFVLSPPAAAATDYGMAAGTLSAGQTYHAQLQFANLEDRNEDDIQLSAQYATITKFDIHTTGHAIAPGPASPYYITAGQQGTVTVVQMTGVKQTWQQHHGDPGEYAIAVLDTVRIMGAAIEGFKSLGSEYTLAGVFTGRELPAPMGNAAFWDGATDGTHNYSVDYNGGGVYRFDAFWGNPQLLFNTSPHYLGITYDPSNDTLWLSQWDNSVIEHRDLNGNLLSSFSVPLTNASCLALDPADGSLWMGSQLNLGTFYQFAPDGTPVTTRFYPSLANQNTLGGEFAFASSSPTPAPSPTSTPKITVSVFPTKILEGNDATFTIASNQAVAQDTTVTFTMSGKAIEGTDYTLSPDTHQVTIPAGAAATTVTLHAILDNVTEKTETASLTLQPGNGYILQNPNKRTATTKIKNVVPPPPSP